MPENDDTLADPVRATKALSLMHRRHAVMVELSRTSPGFFGTARPDVWHYGAAALLASVAGQEDWRKAQEDFRTTAVHKEHLLRLRSQPTILLLRDYHFDQITQKVGAHRRHHEQALAMMLLAFGGLMTFIQDDFDQLQIQRLSETRGARLKEAS